MSKFRDPETVAEEIADDAESGGPGVLRDTLADATATAHNNEQLLSDMVVNLDHICDDRGLLPGSVASDLRQRQTQLREAADWMEEFRVALKDEYDERVEVADA